MRWFLLTLSLMVAAASVAFLRSPIRAVAWHPPVAPSLAVSHERNSAFSSLELLALFDGHGPESIIAGRDGWLYTGLKDGRIVRFRPDGSAMEPYADTGGRPNGMAFDAHGSLLVADSYKGLVSVAPDGSVSVLADACRSIGAWRLDYNRVQPHSSLGDLTPEAFAEKAGLAA